MMLMVMRMDLIWHRMVLLSGQRLKTERKLSVDHA